MDAKQYQKPISDGRYFPTKNDCNDECDFVYGMKYYPKGFKEGSDFIFLPILFR